MVAISLILIVWKNFKLLTPPTFGSLGFLSVNGNGISVSAIMKKLKNGCHFFNIDCTEKFRITNPPKVWISGANFLFSEFFIGSFFPLTHPMVPFQHLCMATLKIFMRGHLCISGLPPRVTYV